MNAIAVAAVLWAWMLGLLIVAALWPRERAWRFDALLMAPLGALVGMAATSVTFFFASALFRHPAAISFSAELVAAGFLALRLRRPASNSPAEREPRGRGWLFWLTASAVAQLALVAAVLAIRAYQAEPHGGWDAWAIWNLHARLMERAGLDWPGILQAPQLSWTHPDYPPLVPSSVARAWAWAGDEAAPAAGLVSAVFGVATVGLLIAAVARGRGRLPALLGGALLLGTPFFVTFSTNEHADIPLGAFMLAAVVLVSLPGPGWHRLAAVCAACAAWTKNEGLLFVLVLAFAWGIKARRSGRRPVVEFLAALGLGLAPLIVFKCWLAPANDLLAAPLAGRIAQLWEPHRHAMILASLWRDLRQFGEWRVTPYFAMALPFLAWKARRPLVAGERIVVVVPGLMLAGYYAVYLLTPQDLEWHLDTSLVRLLVQLWPMALLAWCMMVPCADGSDGSRRSPSARLIFIVANAVVAAAVFGLLSRQPAANELAFRRGVAVVPDEGWFNLERLDQSTWAWSRGDATLQLHVAGRRPENNVTLRFLLRSLAPRRVTIRAGEAVLWQGVVSELEFMPVELAFPSLPPGSTTLRFSTDAPGVPEAATPDARSLAFAVYDLALR